MPLVSIFPRGIEMFLENRVWLKEKKRHGLSYFNAVTIAALPNLSHGQMILFTFLCLKHQMQPVAQYGFNMIRIGHLEKSKVQIEKIIKLHYIIISQYNPDIGETDIVCHIAVNNASDTRNWECFIICIV